MTDLINSTSHEQDGEKIKVGDELISYSNLHIIVCDLYKDYLGKLQKLIVASERLDDIDLELKTLNGKNYEKDKWDTFNQLFPSEVVERVKSINPKTHIFSLTDTPFVRIALSRSVTPDDFEDQDRSLAKLLVKVDQIERAIMSCADFKGDASDIPIAIEDLLRVDKNLATLTSSEYNRVLKESYEAQREEVQEQIDGKLQSIGSLQNEQASISESLTALAVEVLDARDGLLEYHLPYQQYNEAQ